MYITTPSALRVACNVARKVAVNDQGNLKAMLIHFELLPHIISGMSKKIKKFLESLCQGLE
jgi:hypothetical protein